MGVLTGEGGEGGRNQNPDHRMDQFGLICQKLDIFLSRHFWQIFGIHWLIRNFCQNLKQKYFSPSIEGALCYRPDFLFKLSTPWVPVFVFLVQQNGTVPLAFVSKKCNLGTPSGATTRGEMAFGVSEIGIFATTSWATTRGEMAF